MLLDLSAAFDTVTIKFSPMFCDDGLELPQLVMC